jgi:hypothetical protein
MDKRERDRISGLFWIGVAIAVCYGSFKLSLGDFRRPGPGFFSFLSGMVLGVLSLFVILQSFKDRNGIGEKAFWENSRRGMKMIGVIMALFLYGGGMNYLGFSFSTLLFLGFILRGIFVQRWSIVIGSSALVTTVSIGIFKYWLGVPLPEGIFGF